MWLPFYGSYKHAIIMPIAHTDLVERSPSPQRLVELPFPPVTKSHILNCSYHSWYPRYALKAADLPSQLTRIPDAVLSFRKPASFRSPHPSYHTSAQTVYASLLKTTLQTIAGTITPPSKATQMPPRPSTLLSPGKISTQRSKPPSPSSTALSCPS